MRTIAALIARGGSKRLPRKNVLPFCGLPLLAWTIIQAKSSRLIDEVWMSTDDDEIAEISEEYGATVVRRPYWPDADTTSAARPLRHALDAALELGPVDCAVSALVTSPLRKPNDLDRLVAEFYPSMPGSVYAVHPLRELCYHEFVEGGVQLAGFDKSYRYAEVGGSSAFNPRLAKKEDYSDAEVEVMLTAQINAGTSPIWPYITYELWQHNETDTLEEFELTEVLMEQRILQGRGRSVYDEYAKNSRHGQLGENNERME